MLAQLADRAEFLDLLALGDQRDDVLEGSAQERTLEGSNDYNFLLIGRHFGKLDDISKELALIDSDYVELAPAVLQVGD